MQKVEGDEEQKGWFDRQDVWKTRKRPTMIPAGGKAAVRKKEKRKK